MKMTNPVLVRVGDQTTTVEAAYAASKGLEVIEGGRAVDRSGRSLPPSALAQESQIAASIDADIEALKGSALNDALGEAGLPKGGSVVEKRARLVEHRATTANLTPEPSPDGSGSEDSTEGSD